MQDIEVQNFITDYNNYNCIIDARSPREFAYSNIPKSINLFALNDIQFEEIGKIYKKSKSFAKAKGASYICQNLSNHILSFYKDYKIGSKIAIYCAKGGLRSKSIANVLSPIGYRIDRIQGGYKAYRKFILEFLQKSPNFTCLVLHGNTGCGKSELIKRLEPSIDIEDLANHFGSVFGELSGIQPSMKLFENKIAHKLMELKNEKFVFVEGESRQLGKITIPKAFFEKMRTGVNIQVKSSMENRVQRIMKLYSKIDEEFFNLSMRKIKPFMSNAVFDEINLSFRQGNLEKTAEILLSKYYDKVYKKPKQIDFSLDNDDLENATKKLKDIKNNCKINI